CRRAVPVARGVCTRCYKRLHKAVLVGLVNWPELERCGLVRPTSRRPSPPERPGRAVRPAGPPCLTCGQRFSVVRCCSPRCYAPHRQAVASGQTTWAALRARGLVAARGSGRHPDRERRRLATALRAQGLTFAEIGRRLGSTYQGARHLVETHKR